MGYKLINYCEIEPNASRSYSRIHNVSEDLNLGDITKVDAKNIPDFDMLVGGSPCFVAGTKVYTSEGYKNIEDLKVGDLVLTHKNRYMPIDKIGHDYNKDIYEMKAMGSLPVLATKNHPFLIVSRKQKSKTIDGKRKYYYEFSEPYKKKLEELIPNKDFLCSPIIQTEENPLNLDEETCWILGRYVADGHIRYEKRKDRKNSYQYQLILSIGDNKVDSVKKIIKNYSFSCFQHTKSVYRIVFSSKKLVDLVRNLNLGTNAESKRISNKIINLPNNLLEKFIEGYFSGDGSYIEKSNVYKATTISLELALTLQIAIQKAYKVGCKIYFNEKPKTCIIEDRTVNQKNNYMICFIKEQRKQQKYYIKDNMILYPIKSVEDKKYQDTVYNIEVHEDHTYNVQMNICFNCTDFSSAGQQKGSVWTCLDCGYKYNPIEQHYSKRDECPHCHSKNLERTASSLIVEYLRVLREKKPKFCVYENVKNLVGKNFKKTFDLFVKELDEYGYNVYYKVLNAKNYGIPQNRERVILVAIRKDIDNGKFKYPEPFDNGIRLKDLLATQIDDRFYIPKEKTEKLLANLDEEKKQRLFESMNQINSLGLLDFKGNRQCRCVSGANGIAPTLTTMGGGQQEPKILESNMFEGETVSPSEIEKAIQEGNIKEGNPVKESISSFNLPICCASRGRNPENPNSRVSGLPTEQRIEINENETTNTLTSVQKDNWIIEPCILRYARNEYGKKIRKEYESGNLDEKMGNMRDLQMREDGLANTLTSVQKDNYVFEPSWFAIRKLIPLECFRLMGFTDEDFEKAKYYTEEEVKQLPKNKKYKKEISEKGEERYVLLADTHAYKQAGNSIVVNVLYEVYKELYKAMPELFDNLRLVSLFSGIGAFEKGLDMLYAWVNGNFTKEEE